MSKIIRIIAEEMQISWKHGQNFHPYSIPGPHTSMARTIRLLTKKTSIRKLYACNKKNYESTICYLAVLGYFSVVDGRTRVRSINVSNSLEVASYFFYIYLVHFGLSGPLMRCMYSCTMPVSVQINKLIWPDWMVD